MNQLDFSMRGRIIEKCREAGELADALYHDDNRHDVVREQAYSIKKRSKVIEENCSVERYHLYFNGKVGVGKSTAICYLTGLIDKTVLQAGILMICRCLRLPAAGQQYVRQGYCIRKNKAGLLLQRCLGMHSGSM